MKAWRRWLRQWRRRAKPGPIVLAVVVVALAVVPAAFTHTSPRELNYIASWLAMREVSVMCLTEKESEENFVISFYGASAYVDGYYDTKGRWRPSDIAVFAYGHCEPLLALQQGDASAYTVQEIAWAILALTHESGHLRGHLWSASEAKTECWAIRHVPYVIDRLGVTDPIFRSLLIADAVRWHRQLPLSYRLKGCVLPKVERVP